MPSEDQRFRWRRHQWTSKWLFECRVLGCVISVRANFHFDMKPIFATKIISRSPTRPTSAIFIWHSRNYHCPHVRDYHFFVWVCSVYSIRIMNCIQYNFLLTYNLWICNCPHTDKTHNHHSATIITVVWWSFFFLFLSLKYATLPYVSWNKFYLVSAFASATLPHKELCCHNPSST